MSEPTELAVIPPPPPLRIDPLRSSPVSEEEAAPDASPIEEEMKPSPRPAKRSLMVRVVPELLDAFDRHCASTGRSRTENVLIAHIAHADAVAARMAPSAGDAQRMELGLPPETASQPLPPGIPMSMWVTIAAADSITSAAKASNVSIRRWIHELITVFLEAESSDVQ